MKKVNIALALLPIFLVQSCNPTKAPAVDPSTDLAQSHYVRRLNADTVIVFVHGIFGGAVGTWTNPDSHAYWPQMVGDDSPFQNSDVYVYSYSSPYVGHSYTIGELIENMRLVFSNDEVFQKHKKVVFICQSMGGIVVRDFLTRASETFNGSLKKACIPRVKRTRNHRNSVLRTGRVFGIWTSHATALLSNRQP